MINRRDILTVLAFIALVVAVCMLFGGIDSAGGRAQTELVRDAVKSAALTCYAVEGSFPSDLEYLREHYALAYDEERYIVTYDAFASNLLPDIRVIERGAMA